MSSQPLAAARPAAAPAEARADLKLYFVLGSLTLLGPLTLDMYLPAFPSLSRDLHAPESAIQLTITGCLIGLAAGQLIAGPLSDTLGRRRPLLIGLLAYALTSAACALAPSAAILVGARILEGLAGGAALVIATASVRDRFSGREAARFFSLLVLMTGLGPILGPVLGGQMLRFTTWRGIFMVLTVVGLLLIVAVATSLVESLPAERRRHGGAGDAIGSLGTLLKTRSFMAYAVPVGFAMAAFFAYLASSSFVIQDVYGANPQQFGAIFAAIAVGYIAASQVNGRLVRRYSPERLLALSLLAFAIATIALLGEAITRFAGLPGLLVPMFAAVACLGVMGPNAQALALTGIPESAGAGAALLGMIRFGLGAAVAPLAGLIASGSAVPMGLVMASLGLAAGASYLLLRQTRPQAPQAPQAPPGPPEGRFEFISPKN